MTAAPRHTATGPPGLGTREQHSSSGRWSPFARQSAGVVLASLVIASVIVRQLTSNANAPAPSTDAETALGVNAFALQQLPDLSVPSSLSNTVASWQLAGYSYLTSATDRHQTLVGPTRELVLVASVLSAALVIAVCRRLQLGWISASLAAALSGIPAAAALLRIVSAPAAVATFWIALAALSAVVAARRPRYRWPLTTITLVTSWIAILTAEVSALLLLGLVVVLVSARWVAAAWDLKSRVVVVTLLSTALGAVFWLTVWGPPGRAGDVLSIHLAGLAVAGSGLLVAAACSLVAGLRPLALGAVPVLLAAAWPGSDQVSALVLALLIVAFLCAGLLDNLLRQRPPAPEVVIGTVSLVVAVAVGLFLLPVPETAPATVIPNGEVAAWIETQLAPDTVVQVDPLSRAQLVRDGLEPARLRTAREAGPDPEVILAPLSDEAALPLIARFGRGSTLLGLRLVVPDPTAYAAALLEDETARNEFGIALAQNPNLSLGADAAAALRAGHVDARLMLGLAGACSFARITIEQFPGTTGDLDNGNILRQVTLTEIVALDPVVGTSPEALLRVAEFLEEQPAAHRPLAVLEIGNTLTVRYAAPSPLGLLG